MCGSIDCTITTIGISDCAQEECFKSKILLICRNDVFLIKLYIILNTPNQNIPQEVEPKKGLTRIDSQYVSHEMQHLFHLEKGYIFTIKQLLFRPGKAVREFLYEDRNKYVKPIIYVIFNSVLFTLMTNYYEIKFSFFNIDKMPFLKGYLRSKEIGVWSDSHIGYTNLIMGLFIGFWTKLFFKKYGHNIFEIFVLLCYVLGTTILLLIPFLVAAELFNSSFIASCGLLVYFSYIFWAIGQFFGEKKIVNYIKSIVAYIFGNLTYMLTVIFIAYFFKKFTS